MEHSSSTNPAQDEPIVEHRGLFVDEDNQPIKFHLQQDLSEYILANLKDLIEVRFSSSLILQSGNAYHRGMVAHSWRQFLGRDICW